MLWPALLLFLWCSAAFFLSNSKTRFCLREQRSNLLWIFIYHFTNLDVVYTCSWKCTFMVLVYKSFYDKIKHFLVQCKILSTLKMLLLHTRFFLSIFKMLWGKTYFKLCSYCEIEAPLQNGFNGQLTFFTVLTAYYILQNMIYACLKGEY